MTHDDLASGAPGGAPDVAATAIGEWLAELGSPAPAPGGGAAAALTAAVGAALVEMVCNLTIGKPRFAGYEQHVTAVRDRAAKLRTDALGLMGDDAAAFTELVATYRLPRETAEQSARRDSRIQAATVVAASVPLRIAAAGADVARLAAQLPGQSNPTVLSDVGVAAASAAAAIEGAAINVEINLATLKDPDTKAALAGQLGAHLAEAAGARELAAQVRREIAG